MAKKANETAVTEAPEAQPVDRMRALLIKIDALSADALDLIALARDMGETARRAGDIEQHSNLRRVESVAADIVEHLRVIRAAPTQGAWRSLQ